MKLIGALWLPIRLKALSFEAGATIAHSLAIEPLAIMLSNDDPAFKAVVDTEMTRLIRSGEARALYERWFQRPIPPRQISLNLPMNHLLKAFWKQPSATVPD
jgi:glutamate/aspartate transport system substrate-binding protein